MRKLESIALVLLIGAGQAEASCGAAFCSSTNDWLTLNQGVTQGWRIWGQLEYLNQNQLREGTEKTSRAEIDEHHEEVKTINRNALLGLEYGFLPEWSVGLTVPYSNREHLHIHEHHGDQIPERWEFDALGDVRVKLRYQPQRKHAGDVIWSLNGGLKLPTGETGAHNADGDEAERSVQPGSGTADLLLGGGVAYAPMGMSGSLFANLSLQIPVNEKDGYKPGWRTSLQGGWLTPVSSRLDLVLQANLLRTGRDHGINAEPDESGRTELAIVPGLMFALSRSAMLFGQVELPVYQKVNGIQLTHDYAVSLGISLAIN